MKSPIVISKSCTTSLSVHTINEFYVKFIESIHKLNPEQLIEGIKNRNSALWPNPSVTKRAMGWLDIESTERREEILQTIKELRGKFEFKNLYLCGMGGSSLAPLMFFKTYNISNAQILDTDDPEELLQLETKNKEKNLYIISSKSGTTLETLAQLHYLEYLLKDPKESFLIITDRGSYLDEYAKKKGYMVVYGNSNTGGRFSALTEFGLVPLGLFTPLEEIENELISAKNFLESFYRHISLSDNPSLLFGGMLSLLPKYGANRIFLSNKSFIQQLDDWVKQILAESTGKEGTGILPIVVKNINRIHYDGMRMQLIKSKNVLDSNVDVSFLGESLGETIMFFELSVAVAAYFMKINPFDQPNVQEAKDRTTSVLKKGTLQKSGDDNEFNLSHIVSFVKKHTSSDKYIVFCSYLSRLPQVMDVLNIIVDLLSDNLSIPITLETGPSFLHSVGQFHKGGPKTGIFIQLTCETEKDIQMRSPELTNYTFADVKLAQAQGDREALRERGLPVFHVHITNVTKFITDIYNQLLLKIDDRN